MIKNCENQNKKWLKGGLTKKYALKERSEQRRHKHVKKIQENKLPKKTTTKNDKEYDKKGPINVTKKR